MSSSTSSRRLLVVGPLPPGLQALLEARHALTPLWTQPDRAQFLREHQGRFDGAVTMSRHGCQEDVFACIAGGVLGCFGVGFEGVDLPAARRHGVQVSTTPDVLTDCVADLAFGLVLATGRRLIAADRFVQRGDWPKGSFPMATRVSGKKLGILGLGRIGEAVARRAAGFDMPVRYHGRRAKPGVAHGFEPDLLALARWSDFLLVACQGGPSTRHLVSAEVLQALGPEGFLVNIARGSVVDEDALVAALTQGGLGGAGLDVYAHEPKVPQALLGLDHVVLLPHIAASTRDTREAMEKLVVSNLDAFFSTGQVLTPPV